MTKNELAINEFKSGYNCAQSVVSAFCDDLKMDKALALRMSTGFGSGMGRLQGTCGAVTGAFMVIGVSVCNKNENNADRKAKAIEIIQAFNEKFTALHNTTDCRDLLGCNLNTPEGHAYFIDNNLRDKICCKCISDSVDILTDLINSNKN
jgi:C_GCAxxG_C_C family probable redox protein